MSPVFLDTSAVLALLNPKDENHAKAHRAFQTLRARQAPLVATSFVLLETYALLGRRIGRALHAEDLLTKPESRAPSQVHLARCRI